LSTHALGEADLLVVLLTPDRGKLRCAARNARKSKRRFGGGLPGGAMGEAMITPGRGLWRLESFRSIRDLSGLGRDLDRFAYVAYLCEVTDALVHEPEPDPERFAALTEAVTATLEARPDPGVLRRFELKLLQTLGLLPTLDVCCVCGGELGLGDVPFDACRGGALCPLHAGAAPTISDRVQQLALRLLHEGGPVLLELAGADAGHRRALRDLTAGVIRAQLRRPLRSLDFLRQVSARPEQSG
jgi:DNA repair protein RecO (recombination protein O)